MRGVRVAGAVSAAVVTVFGSVSLAPPASASNYGVELNGTYRMISNGDWAKTNEVFINEQTQVQTWTFNSSCESPIRCTGTVTSDQGWTAPMTNTGDYWVAERVVENWEPCPASYSYPGAEIFTGAGGTSASAIQRFWFWGWDPVNSQRDTKIRDLLAGRTRTQADSGACGINKPLVIEVPIRLEQLS
ncbi:Rv2253/PknI dimerization domain-containing protein [Mycobacterium sp. MMS18-G62]